MPRQGRNCNLHASGGNAIPHIIGAGVGRTGTYSLKLAINQLGLGPCQHMEAVLHDMAVQVPLWSDAVCGRPDWRRIYSGFAGPVDWPTARYFRELGAAYPSAKFVLTIRDPEKWADSFAATIYTLLAGREHAPPDKRAWLEMAGRIIAQNSGTGSPARSDTSSPCCPSSRAPDVAARSHLLTSSSTATGSFAPLP